MSAYCNYNIWCNVALASRMNAPDSASTTIKAHEYCPRDQNGILIFKYFISCWLEVHMSNLHAVVDWIATGAGNNYEANPLILFIKTFHQNEIFHWFRYLL